MTERMRPRDRLRRILEWTLPYEIRDSVSAELSEAYAGRAAGRGRASADGWYLRQVCGCVLRLGAERVRDVVGTADAWRGEIRQAARTFVRQPGYSGAFITILALSAGGVTAVYSVADRLLLRSVPNVTGPDELVTIRLVSAEAPAHVSWRVSNPDLHTLQESMTTVHDLSAMSPLDVHIHMGADGAQRLGAGIVTPNFFDVLGIRMRAGRGFHVGDAAAGTGVVVSFDLARSLANDAAEAIGRSVRVNGRQYDVIGVAPRGFHGADLAGRAQMWFVLASLPLLDASVPADMATQRAGNAWSTLYARRVPGASSDDVLRNLEAGRARIQREYAGEWHSFLASHLRFDVTSGVGLDPGLRPTVERTLAMLGGAAILLLLLGTANLANLTLTRAISQHAVAGVRMALGASRARVARELWIETLLLGSAGGLAAWTLSLLWVDLFDGMQLTAGATLGPPSVSPRGILFAVAGAVAAAGIAGMQPALIAGRHALEGTLRNVRSGGLRGHRVRAVLVAAQIALSMMLVLGAGLLGRTVANLRDIDLGFDPDGIVTFAMDPALDGIELSRAEALALQLESEFAHAPGVRAAGWVSPAPLRGSYVTASLEVPGAPTDERAIGAGFFMTPGFMRALGVRVLAGDAAWQTQPGTVVISRNVASALFPGQPAPTIIGRPVVARGGDLRVVAVIEDIQLSDITREATPLILRPFAERSSSMPMTAFVRGDIGVRGVHRILEQRGGDEPYFDLRTARSAIDEQFAERNLMARVAIVLGILGVLIAAVGLYAMLAYAVVVRRHEIGIRIALGATASDIRREFMQRGMMLTMVGAIAGAFGGLIVSRVLQSQLYGVDSFDTGTYIGAMLVIIVVATVTALVPSMQAMRVPPVEALHSD